jgi:hypothetical protein
MARLDHYSNGTGNCGDTQDSVKLAVLRQERLGYSVVVVE